LIIKQKKGKFTILKKFSMKKFSFLIVILSLFACHSSKNMIRIEQPIEQIQTKQKDQFVITEKMEILPHQEIQIEKDSYSNKHKVKIVKGNKTVFKYTYTSEPNNSILKDAKYVQTVFFEIDNPVKAIHLKDQDLNKVKLTAEMSGYRNSAIFPIVKGQLSIEIKNKNEVIVDIQMDDIYQVFKKRNIHQKILIP